MAVLRVTRFLLLALLCVVIVGSHISAADTSTSSSKQSAKAYSPFDEPRPKIPQEIIDDKRLDMKVKVFCKSKNMKQLFADLTEKTGVKITANRKLWGERPIIYFHNRPLRDVMTEISGLYGYRWLIGGNPGAYEYEMFEDIRHSKRRDEVDDQTSAERRALVDKFTEKAIADPKILDDAVMLSDEESEPMFPIHSGKGLPGLLRAMDPVWLADAFAGEDHPGVQFSELPAELQTAALQWQQSFRDGFVEWSTGRGREMAPRTYTASDMQGAILQVMGGLVDGVDIPRVSFMLVGGSAKAACISSWPPSSIGEDSIRTILKEPQREKQRLEVPLPSKKEITANKARCAEYGDGYVTLGDVLQAVAEQTNTDVVADYYLQDYNIMSPMDKMPLKKALQQLVDELHYYFQYDGSILRGRDYAWFNRTLLPEPPFSLIDRCWSLITEKGALDIETMIEIVCLPDDQLQWEGFAFIPHAEAVWLCSDSLRMWKALGSTMVSQAMSESGLPVADLTEEQFTLLQEWRASANASSDMEVDDAMLRSGVIKINHKIEPKDEGGEQYELTVRFKDSDAVLSEGPIRMSPEFTDKQIKTILAQRKADTAADSVEVLK